MNRRLAQLITLPHRLIMLGMGHYCWCTTCHTIVSGGFGGTDGAGRKTFECITCAYKHSTRIKHDHQLNDAMLKDPIRQEEQ